MIWSPRVHDNKPCYEVKRLTFSEKYENKIKYMPNLLHIIVFIFVETFCIHNRTYKGKGFSQPVYTCFFFAEQDSRQKKNIPKIKGNLYAHNFL